MEALEEYKLQNKILEGYLKYTRRKLLFISFLLVFLLIFSLYALCIGTYNLTIGEVISSLSFSKISAFINNRDVDSKSLILLNVRLPRIISAIIAGIILSISGAVMQSILRNPLASPFTLGISQGAAFGAAFAIVVLNAGSVHSHSSDAILINNPYLTTTFAFIGSLIGTITILLLAKWRGLSPTSAILAGNALASLFNAGTTLLQTFATDVKVASIVFWLFGDLGRVNWRDIGIMSIACIIGLLYFLKNRWNYNALEEGEDTAKSLGVNTQRLRIEGMLISSFITSVVVSLMGVIGFIGLVAPHMVRRLIGNDFRFLLPASALLGALLLLISDTLSRTIISPIILPVGVITSFMGAPIFLYLLIRSKRWS
ncbi:MAG: iron ABC transporter permease [Dictyoglomus sp. NZ13-RE01]|nr:MAG: iron ABC transporter permease [Dictyoglomus sp. NZ13-RE01]